MNNKQYEEYLLSILTYCESLESPTDIKDNEENPFGLSCYDFREMVLGLNRNHYINAIPYLGGVILYSLTFEGREKLEKLREKLSNR